MAKATGYTCDRIDCSKFETSATPDLPSGWIKLVVTPKDPLENLVGRDHLELCSNFCAAMVCIERTEMDTGKKFIRSGAPAKTGITRGDPGSASKVRWHRQGKHDANPVDGCSECERATAP